MTDPVRCILLTGANGFVGTRLAAKLGALAAPDRSLVAFGRSSPSEGWSAMDVNVCDESDVASAMGDVKPDIVVHLAAQSSVASGQVSAEETWRTNFGGTLSVASACARASPRATLLFASTAEVYGATFNEGIVDETCPPRPMNAYARSKAAAEAMLPDVLAPTNRLIVARAFNHTGGGQDGRFALPSFAAQIARIAKHRQPPVVRVGNLGVARDFLHVDDVVDAYLLLLSMRHELPERGVFNVCSGESRSLRSLLEDLRAVSGVHFEIEIDAARLRANDILDARGDNARLREATGWAPKRAMIDLLRELFDYAIVAAERPDGQ